MARASRSQDGGRKPTPSGEGERRAQRGYVPQYRRSAALIYDHLAAGRLRWIGVAHRGAGSFDDIVLAFEDRIVGHQVKTRLNPGTFRLETLLLGAEALWAAMQESLAALALLEADQKVSVVYACDDSPSLDDRLAGVDGATSAGLIDLHRQHAATWTWSDWTLTPFVPFLEKLRNASDLDEGGFMAVWQAISFVTGGEGRFSLGSERTTYDTGRIEALAALLPRLAAHASDTDLWEVATVRNHLGWSDAFKPRHAHRFPVAAFYQENDQARLLIAQALAGASQGYLSLVGPPGSGKSTLLAAGVVDAERMRTLRYLAFVPGQGQTTGRAEAFDFFHDLITLFKQQGLGPTVVPGHTVPELREQFQQLLREAGERSRRDGVRTLIIIDGLDHVPREERYDQSFLTVLPPPEAIPDGILLLLGTQRLDLSDIPPPVQRQANEPGRRVNIPPLSHEAVALMAAAAKLPEDVDRADLRERGGGHPLSTRYLIEGLLSESDEAGRRAWLARTPEYVGDVDRFYLSAWTGLKDNADARKALGLIALAEGPLRQTALDDLVGRDALDATWNAAHHLLTVGPAGDLAVFHNSFRLFLQDQTLQRLGRTDETLRRERYGSLAEMARRAAGDDPQRWMEMRYRARAEDDDAVLALATPERFREQFIDGRDPQDIQDDVGLAFRAVGRSRQSGPLLPLLFARHEIALRSEAIGSEIVDAFLAIGDRDGARNMLRTDGATLSEDVGYRVIDADLEAGDLVQARAAFDALEPLDQLLGAKPVSDVPWEDELTDWARRALAFRPIPQVLRILERLTPPVETFRSVDMDEMRWRLKLSALQGELHRRPEQDPEALRLALELPQTDKAVVQLYGAVAARALGRPQDAVIRVEAALDALTDLEDHERLTLGVLGRRLSRPDLAERAMADLAAPTLRPSALQDPEDLNVQIDAVLDHAQTRAGLGWPEQRGAVHDKPFLASVQHRLEDLGRTFGLIERGEMAAAPALALFKASVDFLARQKGEDLHDYDRNRLDRALDRIISRIVASAGLIGEATLRAVLVRLDETEPRDWRLRRPDVRRAFGLAAFRCDGDLEAARRRVAYVAGGERTPEAQLAEAAEAAQALAALGLAGEARALLTTMHHEGLGLSRPAKKDPQYFAWIELLESACASDPDRREDRVRFLMQFVSGLSDNEAYDLGGRTLPALLTEAAQGQASFAGIVADRAWRLANANWVTMIAAVGRGVARARPDLTLATATIVGRLAATYVGEYDPDPFDGLIASADETRLRAVVQRSLDIVETDTADGVRLNLLEAAIGEARKRGLEIGLDTLARWRGELPPPSSKSSPEDPFFQARSLSDIEALLSDPEARSRWNASRAFVRLAPDAGHGASRSLLDRWPELLEDRHVLRVMADLAIEEGALEAAAEARDSLVALAESAQYDDGWAAGARLLAVEVDVALRGDAARREAFESLCRDLAGGRVWPIRLLQHIVDVLKVISPAPNWEEAWSALEAHLSVFREFPQGDPLEVTTAARSPWKDGVTILADLLARALALGPIALAERTRLALVELASDEVAQPIVACLVDRLLDGADETSLVGAQLAWSHRDLEPVRFAVAPRLPDLLAHPDFGVRDIAGALWAEWSRADDPPPPDRVGPRAPSSEATQAFMDEIWPILPHLQATARATGQDPIVLGRRAAGLLGGLQEPPSEEAELRLGGRAEALDVYGPQVRWTARAAFLAQRLLLAEMVDAGDLDPGLAARISRSSGVDGLIDYDRHIEPRPVGLPRPTFGDPFRNEHYETWLEGVDEDLTPPHIENWTILGGWSRHRSVKRSGDQCAEQLYGVFGAGDDLDEALKVLPRMRLGRAFELEVREDDVPAGLRRISGPVYWEREPSLGLCPDLAERLGWRISTRNPTRFADNAGNLTVRTLSWRDAGSTGHIHGEAVLRDGQLVIATPQAAERLRPHMTIDSRVRVWRRVVRDGRLSTSVKSSS